jgi:hypothetical protein
MVAVEARSSSSASSFSTENDSRDDRDSLAEEGGSWHRDAAIELPEIFDTECLAELRLSRRDTSDTEYPFDTKFALWMKPRNRLRYEAPSTEHFVDEPERPELREEGSMMGRFLEELSPESLLNDPSSEVVSAGFLLAKDNRPIECPRPASVIGTVR